jgi:glycosyltransferase involved in cell wall biosynthesis
LTVRYSARRAARVIALSEHGRNDLISTYGIEPELVSAIPLAAPTHFSPVEPEKELQRVRQIYGIDGEYILSVGSIQPRKNLGRLIAAYGRYRAQRPKSKLPKLVLVGKRAWLYDETIQAIKDCGLTDDVILTGYVPEKDLPALYSGALCFVYPSYFEGFGLPPIEAMKCGAPVIVGNQTSLPEVVGDAAVLVDPFSIDSIALAMGRVIDDSDFRKKLRVKGLDRARRFSWQQTAQRTLDVYRKAAGSSLIMNSPMHKVRSVS